MTRRNDRRWLMIGGAVICAVIAGTFIARENDEALRFGVLPSVRAKVVFSEPVHHRDLIKKLDSLAEEQGFPHRAGQTLETNLQRGKESPEHPFGYSWFQQRSLLYSADPTNYRVSFDWPHVGESTNWMRLIFYGTAVRPFSIDEWRMVACWLDLLPATLPVDGVSLLRHPYKYTRLGDLRRFAEQTGLALPKIAIECIETCRKRGADDDMTPYECC